MRYCTRSLQVQLYQSLEQQHMLAQTVSILSGADEREAQENDVKAAETSSDSTIQRIGNSGLSELRTGFLDET